MSNRDSPMATRRTPRLRHLRLVPPPKSRVKWLLIATAIMGMVLAAMVLL